jgi:hypothetical protein
VNSCINCSQPVSTPYCGQCGQQVGVKQITWRSLFYDLQNRWFGFDNKLARTIRDLTVRPQEVISGMLSGNRVKYLGPLGYFITASAVMLLTLALLDVSVEEFMHASQSFQKDINPNGSTDFAKKVEVVNKKLSAYFRFLPILLAPFFALSTKWVYRKNKLSYLEHIVIYLYLVAHTFWLAPLQVGYYKLTGTVPFLTAMGIMIAFAAYYNAKIFSLRQSVFSYLKGAGVYLLGFILYGLFMFTIALLLGLVVHLVKSLA